MPRLKLTAVRLDGPDGATLVSDAVVRAELDVLPLLIGRVEVGELSLTDASIRIRAASDGKGAWETTRDRLRSVDTVPRLDRLVLRNCRLTIEDGGTAAVATLGQLNLVANRQASTDTIDLAGSAEIRGELLDGVLSGLDLAALARGSRQPIALRLSGRPGRIVARGHLDGVEAPRFAGLLSIETPALGRLLGWTGFAGDLAGPERPLTLSGNATLAATELAWPQIAVEFGLDRAEGSLAIGLAERRPKVRATLAGGQIDLGWLRPYLESEGRPWADAIATRADYDLRLSASELRLGDLRLGEAAAAVLIGQDRLELSLARAALAEGVVKAKVASALAADGRRDVRGQISVDRVDLGTLLAEIGGPRTISGKAAGQATFEGVGETPASLMRHLRGRGTLVVRDGELSGVSIGDAFRRSTARVAEAAASDWRGGRTPFVQAYATFAVADGIAQVGDAAVETATTRTVVEGRVSLTDRFASLTATTRGATDTPWESRAPLVLDLNGPLDRLVTMASPGQDALLHLPR